jgi:hypothetical protein
MGLDFGNVEGLKGLQTAGALKTAEPRQAGSLAHATPAAPVAADVPPAAVDLLLELRDLFGQALDVSCTAPEDAEAAIASVAREVATHSTMTPHEVARMLLEWNSAAPGRRPEAIIQRAVAAGCTVAWSDPRGRYAIVGVNALGEPQMAIRDVAAAGPLPLAVPDVPDGFDWPATLTVEHDALRKAAEDVLAADVDAAQALQEPLRLALGADAGADEIIASARHALQVSLMAARAHLSYVHRALAFCEARREAARVLSETEGARSQKVWDETAQRIIAQGLNPQVIRAAALQGPDAAKAAAVGQAANLPEVQAAQRRAEVALHLMQPTTAEEGVLANELAKAEEGVRAVVRSLLPIR